MSELKAFESERIYWAVEQVEREAGDIDNLHLDDNLFYIKSEADKVIADLEESHKMEVEQLLIEIVELKVENKRLRGESCKLTDGCLRLKQCRKEKANIADKLCHSNHKRCLAMAKWCRTSARYDEGLGAFRYRDWYQKWKYRWLELAEKFKEAK